MDAGPAGSNTDRVNWELRDGVAILTVNNPPVNALVKPVRAALSEAIMRASEHPDVAAVLIRAEGRTFPAGADVREFTQASGHPTLSELCDTVEFCPKPVIAAIHGTALGGGFELALACHYRMALPDARFGFPEVTLGLVPNAGGTQRLPRIVGARVALDMLTSGKPIDARRAEAAGLVDKVVQKNLERAALGSARNMGEAGTLPRPTRDRMDGLREPAQFLDVVRARRRMIEREDSAAARLIELVEAALLLPFEAGQDMERVAYEDLVNSETARGLRHAFLAERRAGRFPSLAGVAAQTVSAVGVVGAGPLARDVAMSALAAGVPVTVALEDDTAISRVRGRIERAYADAVGAGRIAGKDRDAHLSRLVVSDDYRSLSDADVIIDGLPEDSVRKAHVLGRVGAVAMRHAVLASSTAECDVEALAQASTRPERFAAMHFAGTGPRNRLVEVAPGRETMPQATMTLLRLARAMGKGPVLTAARPGLVFNRLRLAYYTAAALLLERGAMPGDVDAAMRDYGMPLGPFQAQDVAGIDAVWGLGAEDCASPIPLRMIENAWYGQRSGQGFYIYQEGDKRARVAPDGIQMIRALRAEKGIEAREIGADEIVSRCLYAMANEGARLVAARVVARPSDVDAVMLLGAGFPRARGGPMLAADLAGALSVRKALTGWAAEDDFWTPATLWDDMVKYGRSFEKLNAD
jgi:3-hydroxyacyl-CoA dehydrogenase